MSHSPRISSLIVCTFIGIAQQTVIHTESQALSSNPNYVKFILYKFDNTTSELDPRNDGGAELLDGLPLVLFVNGFCNSVNEPSGFVQSLVNGLITSGARQFNIVGVDWDRLNGANVNILGILGNLLLPIYYKAAIRNVDVVGSRIADFMHFANREFNVSFKQMHIISHSLGSHIAGAAGKFLHSKYRGEVGRISGLDPAGPGFEFSPLPRTIHKLTKADASFVDIYHSNQDSLGDFERYTGHVNIFINGGNDQPGCEEFDAKGITNSDTYLVGWCSHTYSWVFFKNSMHSDRRYLACPCLGTMCNCKSCFNKGCNGSEIVGMWMPKRLRGEYIVIAEEPIGLIS